MRKINTDHTYEYNDVTGYVTNCFGDDMRGTDDHIDELNLLMGEIRALTEKRDRLINSIEPLKYWRDISECDCSNPLPQGGCLRCDLERILKTINPNHNEQ